MGRRRELIITGGINVAPADVEAALAGYPGLLEAAAFAVPDDRLGEVVALAYVPAQPAGFDLRGLRRHCGRHLADFQQPRKFLALAELPRNAMGKPTRHRLLDLYRATEAA
jgi:long-chain acyl-CoA synthetase